MKNIEKELMDLKIARLLCDYTKNSKVYDVKFIDAVLDIAVNGKKLNKYLRNYEINMSELKANAAEYNGETKKVVIYKKSMCDYFRTIFKTISMFPIEERILYMNSVAAQVLLHEVEHANQKKIIDTEDGIESRILKLCEFEDMSKIEILLDRGEINEDEVELYIGTKLDRYSRNYTKLYDYAPHERLAQIKSYQEIIDALKFIDIFSKVTKDKEYNKLENVLRGYEDTFSPTIIYLNEQGRNKDLKKFDWYSDDKEEAIKLSKEKYNLKDRMKYGLPVNKDEYQFVKKIYEDMTR